VHCGAREWTVERGSGLWSEGVHCGAREWTVKRGSGLWTTPACPLPGCTTPAPMTTDPPPGHAVVVMLTSNTSQYTTLHYTTIPWEGSGGQGAGGPQQHSNTATEGEGEERAYTTLHYNTMHLLTCPGGQGARGPQQQGCPLVLGNLKLTHST
jgi:hypothetical protein